MMDEFTKALLRQHLQRLATGGVVDPMNQRTPVPTTPTATPMAPGPAAPAAGGPTPVIPPPPGAVMPGMAGMGPQGTQVQSASNNPYQSGMPFSNNFTAAVPTSNLNFNPGQYGNTLSGSQSALSGLSRSLQDQMNGGGPNLAAAQEKTATDRNIAQAYAMAQSNPNDAGALRNISNRVSAATQEAAGQSATQRMQQQLAAQEQLGQLNLGMFGTSGRLQTDAEKMGLEQAQGNQAAYLNAQGLNAQTSAQNQQAATGQLQQGVQMAGGAVGAGGAALANWATSGNKSPQTVGGTSSGGDVVPATPMGGGDTSGAGDFGGGGDAQFAAHGGLIHALLQHYAGGGPVSAMAPNASPANFTDYSGTSEVGDPRSPNLLTSGAQAYAPWNKGQPIDGRSDIGKALTGAGHVALGSVPFVGGLLNAIPDHAHGGYINATDGGPVDGDARAAGDSLKNDTVPAMLSPGEIVIPRSITQDDDAAEKAKMFVEAIQRKHKSRKAAYA